MTEYSVGEVRDSVHWLRAKYARHGEDEDRQAADQLESYADLREQIERAREGVSRDVLAKAVCARNIELTRQQREGLAHNEDAALMCALQSVAHLLPSERGGVGAVPVPVSLARTHKDQSYVTLGFADDARCTAFIKSVTRGNLTTHPPAQAAQGEAVDVRAAFLRMLERGNHRTDGDLAKLLDRLEHMVRGDQDCIAGQRMLISDLKAKAAQPRAVPDAIVELSECRSHGWSDSAHAYRAGWNDYRKEMLAAPPSTPNTTGAIGENGK